MEQELSYKGIRYVIGSEASQERTWAVYPQNGPKQGVARGLARVRGARGSFKEAVMAAQAAIDDWLAAEEKHDATGP